MKPGRNDPCPCGSGKKFKNCCAGKSTVIQVQAPPLSECEQLVALFDAGRFAEVQSRAQSLSSHYPQSGFVWHMLGCALELQGQDGLSALQKATQLLPGDAGAHNNLGAALNDRGQLDGAVASYHRALALNPDYAEAHYNLGNAQTDLGQLHDAVASYRRALAIKPDHAAAHSNLGNAQKNLGHLDEAVTSYRRALEINPDFADAHSNLLLAMHYSDRYSPAEIFAGHLAFARQFEQPLKACWQPHKNSIEAHRRLKVGYVSPDFRQHSVAYFIEPVLAQHDKGNVEVTCYDNFPRHDAVTGRIRQHADHWVDCARFSDEQLAAQIRSDGIDILVDLAGHTAGNRLLTFARKPAPVQVTWLGYPATTGLAAIDYRLTDHQADPVGMTEPLNSETLWRLPGLFWCYRPHANSPPVIDHPPSADQGYLTFGSFNNLAKLNDTVLRLWAQILARLPTARLLLKIKAIDQPIVRTATQARLQRLGIPLERLMLAPHSDDYLNDYNQLDVALDTIPFNGGTTSMDALWMGVPFITLAGNSCISRMGVTLLTQAGLPELIAETPQAYVDLAVRLATEPAWLRALRHQLRQRVSHSPLLAEAAFTHQLEAAYRGMWLAHVSKK